MCVCVCVHAFERGVSGALEVVPHRESRMLNALAALRSKSLQVAESIAPLLIIRGHPYALAAFHGYPYPLKAIHAHPHLLITTHPTHDHSYSPTPTHCHLHPSITQVTESIALSRDHCEVRFIPVRDFNTQVNSETHNTRPLSDRPSLSLVAWDGTGGRALGRPWEARAVDVSSAGAAVGSQTVDIYVRIRNSIDTPYLNMWASTLAFADGDTDTSVAETSSGTLAVVDPDARGTAGITVAVQAGAYF